MNPMTVVDKTIYDRLRADTGTGGILNVGTPLVQGVYATAAPKDTTTAIENGTSLPIIVYAHTWTADDAEGLDQWRHTILVEIIGSRMRSLDDIGAIYNRVWGNANANGGEPTYGLHLWAPATANGYRFSELRGTDGATAHDDQVYVYQQTYEMFVAKAHTSP